MNEVTQPQKAPEAFRFVEFLAIGVLAVGGVVVILGSSHVLAALGVVCSAAPGDASIGALIVGVVSVLVGLPLSIVSAILAALATRLPLLLRLVSVTPGLLALVAGCTILGIVYA